MPSHHTLVHLQAAEAVASAVGLAATDLKVEAPPRPELGDLAIGCFAIAKARGTNPAQVAQEIAAAFEPRGMVASATASGPFINLRVDRAETLRYLIDACLHGTLIPSRIGTDKTICIDYSSPNISKHLAYHHLRGTTIGHALVRIYRALGYRVVGINFLGDWGTTHGMLLAAWSLWGPIEPLDVAALNQLYVRFNEAMKQNPELEKQGREWFKRLEQGDPDARALWQRFRDVSWAEFETVYKTLDIEFDEIRGESAYEPDLPRVIAELEAKGLVTISEGAQVVEIEGEKTPVLLRKQDGSTLYATRDVAAAQYRWANYHFTRSLYVVGREQSLHFRQLFKLLAKAGHDWAVRCQHVPYGHVRMQGKKTATRMGNVVLMKHVFDIMQDEVRPRIAEANPEMSAEQVERTARDVGIGAVVFANLASQREKDVDFEIEKVTSTSGDSGPYLQYSHARCAGILRKAGLVRTAGTPLVDLDGIDFTRLANDAGWAERGGAGIHPEWAIARRLLDFPDVVVRAVLGPADKHTCEPHVICHYLLELASDFSRWYTAGNGDPSLRVLCDDLELRRARLALTAAVQAVLATGLGLLGIAAPDQM
jgi:arginyl-tRNA synthetase